MSFFVVLLHVHFPLHLSPSHSWPIACAGLSVFVRTHAGTFLVVPINRHDDFKTTSSTCRFGTTVDTVICVRVCAATCVCVRAFAVCTAATVLKKYYITLGLHNSRRESEERHVCVFVCVRTNVHTWCMCVCACVRCCIDTCSEAGQLCVSSGSNKVYSCQENFCSTL